MITKNGQVFDREQEHEIIVGSPGMHLEVVFTNGRKNSFNNITEVHWRYGSIMGKRVAFETNVHSTGFTYDCDSIESLIITDEKEVMEKV